MPNRTEAGKLSLSKNSPYLTSKRYWGVFWIDASTLKAADRSYEQIGDIFRKGATPAGGRFWLSQQHQPWLMIVDNADDPDLDMPSVLPNWNSWPYIDHLAQPKRERPCDRWHYPPDEDGTGGSH